MKLDSILHLSNVLLSRDFTSADQVQGPCRLFRAILTEVDMKDMQPLAAPMQDFDGDWYVPFEVSRDGGPTYYVIIYAPKGEKVITAKKPGQVS